MAILRQPPRLTTGNPADNLRACVTGTSVPQTRAPRRDTAVKNPSQPRTVDVPKSVVLVGLMGAGKSHIGRRLAQRLKLTFVDADQEIEKAAGRPIEDIFREFGEDEFRQGERRVIARLLDADKIVLATGGGAFMSDETRERILENSISVWLRADLDLLLKRTSRRDNRPLLKTGDPREILQRLIDERYPVYAQADITVDSVDGPGGTTLNRVVDALARWIDDQPDEFVDAAELGT